MENKPRIRFKGFTEDWEQRKLSDVADVRDGTHDSPKFYNDGFPLVTSKNLKGSSIDFSDCSFISEEDFNEINKRSKVDPGDILFGMIGTIGNPAIVEHTGFAIKNVALIKEGHIINNRFIYHLLSSKVFENYIARENAGGTQKFIALNQIRNFDFLAPALVEQNKIIELLDCISQNITLHQCKLEKLKLTKKSLLQKLFPKNGKHIPEIRFKGFTDAWEQRKLGDTNTFFTDGNYGNDYPTTNEMSDSVNGVPFLRGSNLDNGAINLVDVNYITKQKHNLLTSGHTKFDDIIIAVRGSLGNCGYVAKQFIDININSQLAIIRTDKNEVSGLFLIEYLLSSLGKKEINRNITGTALKQLPINSLKMINIKYPSINEQEKISILLSKLNASITLHQRKLERLQEVKKGLLQKMFV